MLITALLMAGALMAGDPDGVVATAPATSVDLGATGTPDAPSVVGAAQAAVPHNLTTAEQVDRWIGARSVESRPYDRPWGELPDEGLSHSEVSVSLGTGGYRDYGASVSLPIGEHGRLDLSYRQVENGYPYGGYGYGYGDGYALGPGRAGATFDDSGYVFPGHRPGAAVEFEARAMRPDGPPNWRSRVQPLRMAP
jgi:hypothetical protein